MKIYLWKNEGTRTDFSSVDNLPADHSSCLVVLAETKERAIKLGKEFIETNDRLSDNPVELEIDKEGIIAYADGDC